MRVDSASGLLEGAAYLPSPNCDARPAGECIDLVVIHAISLPPGEYGGGWIADLFLNRLDPEAHPYFREVHQLKVSAHLLIRRDGELLQFVPFGQRAWHAGVSSFGGRERCNDFSIGIELEGGDEEPFTAVQYAVLNQVLAALRAAYPAISRERLAGHCDVAPGRKTDPGPHFDWEQVRLA